MHAPMAVKRFHPGQFYRLQNFETCSTAGDTKLAMEGMRSQARRWMSQRTGLDDRAGDGRIGGSMRQAQTGRARNPDGSHRHAHGNPAG